MTSRFFTSRVRSLLETQRQDDRRVRSHLKLFYGTLLTAVVIFGFGGGVVRPTIAYYTTGIDAGEVVSLSISLSLAITGVAASVFMVAARVVRPRDGE